MVRSRIIRTFALSGQMLLENRRPDQLNIYDILKDVG